jgi:hypothetical protein
VQDVAHALIERDARAEREDQQGDDETPEIEFAAVPEWMGQVCWPRCASQAVQQQHAVAGIDQGMHAFRQHCRTAGDEGRDELGDRDQQIAYERCVDHGFRG